MRRRAPRSVRRLGEMKMFWMVWMASSAELEDEVGDVGIDDSEM